MMKLLSIMLICAFLSDICCAIPRPQGQLKKQRGLQELSEKPSLLTKRDGNYNYKLSLPRLAVVPQVRQVSITPDMIMPQPLNLRLNNNYKQTYTTNRSKTQEIPSNKKVALLPINRIQLPAFKQNVTDNHLDASSEITKIRDGNKINNNKKFFIDIDDNNDYDEYKNTDSKLDQSHQVDYKILEHLSNRTKSLFQPPVTEIKESVVKPNISSNNRPVISVIKEERVVDKVLKRITNDVESIVNNTDAIKCNTEGTKSGVIANDGMPKNKIINQEGNSQDATNIMPHIMHHNDNAYTTKFEINVYPYVFPRCLINDRSDTIVIKNHGYKEALERDNYGLTVNSSQELGTLNDKLDPIQNTNEVYIPDTTFIKLPYKYPLDCVNHLWEKKKGDELEAENNIDDLRGKIWRTWNDTEIHIKSNDEHNACDKGHANNLYKGTGTTFANQVKPATSNWWYSPRYGQCFYPTYYSYYDPSCLYHNC